MRWRPPLGIACGAVVAVFGALILGEYEFTGSFPYVAGPLFGILIGEVVVGVGQSRTPTVSGFTAVLAAAGVAWAGWIDSTQGVEPVRRLVWVAAALAALAAVLRTRGVRGRSASHR